jgi:hypothetical protein
MASSGISKQYGPQPAAHLEFLDEGAVAVITLDDAKRGNAMSSEMGMLSPPRSTGSKTATSCTPRSSGELARISPSEAPATC